MGVRENCNRGNLTLGAVLQYVDTQQEHHRTHTFQDEYRELLHKHGLDVDERYVWD
jgi:hypothetical protein